MGIVQAAAISRSLHAVIQSGSAALHPDPFYLVGKQTGFEPRFIELAGRSMLDAAFRRRQDRGRVEPASSRSTGPRCRPRVAYKRDIDDIRVAIARRDDAAAPKGPRSIRRSARPDIAGAAQ